MVAEAIWLGLEHCPNARRISRHCHHRAYAALVVEGGYAEAGDGGRHQVGPGDVLIHGRYEAHQNEFGPCGAVILNLPCPQGVIGQLARIEDPDAIVRIAERDPREAAEMMFAGLLPLRSRADDWPDVLAAALDRDSVPSLALWAEATGLKPTSVSRGFALAYGTSPQRFRADRRACRAVQAIVGSSRSLAEVALDSGFADQPHMSREILRLTGLSPRQLRTADAKCIQERDAIGVLDGAGIRSTAAVRNRGSVDDEPPADH